jgi:hypothetical protein
MFTGKTNCSNQGKIYDITNRNKRMDLSVNITRADYGYCPLCRRTGL